MSFTPVSALSEGTCTDYVHWGVTSASVFWSREVSAIQRSQCTANYSEWFGTTASCPHCESFCNMGSQLSEVPLYWSKCLTIYLQCIRRWCRHSDNWIMLRVDYSQRNEHYSPEKFQWGFYRSHSAWGCLSGEHTVETHRLSFLSEGPAKQQGIQLQ